MLLAMVGKQGYVQTEFLYLTNGFEALWGQNGCSTLCSAKIPRGPVHSTWDVQLNCAQ